LNASGYRSAAESGFKTPQMPLAHAPEKPETRSNRASGSARENSAPRQPKYSPGRIGKSPDDDAATYTAPTGATAIVKLTGPTPNDISVTAPFGKTEGSGD